MSYIRERRPELFGEKRKPLSIFSIEPHQVARAPSVSFKDTETWVAENHALVVDIRAAVAFEHGSFPGTLSLEGGLLAWRSFRAGQEYF